MFDQLVLSAVTRKRTGRWLYFTGTAAAWVMALTTTIIGGIFAYDARLDDHFKALVPVIMPPPIRKGVQAPDNGARSGPAKEFVSQKTAPVDIPAVSSAPPDISRVIGFTGSGEDGPAGDPDGVLDGVPDGVKYGIPHGASTGNPPPPPPEIKKVEPDPPAKPQQTTVLRVSTVLQGTAIRRVQPPYPLLARNARVSGQVVVEVTIDQQGNVIDARALSGHALLRQVSVDAARGWKWRPTMLNGVPVKVIGTITFNFQL